MIKYRNSDDLWPRQYATQFWEFIMLDISHLITRMESKFVSVLFLMVLVIVQCVSLKPKYSTKTSYDRSFNNNNILTRENSWQELSKEFSPELQTCTPVGLYIVYRHGSRYPSDKDINKYNSFLEKTRNESINPDFQHLQNEKEMSVDLQRTLSESGKVEMNHLAKRLKKRFPDLFQSQFHLTDYAFQSSNLSRTIDSTISFIQGFVDDDYNCSSALTEDELLVSCQNSSSSGETVVVPLHNKTSDYLLRFFDAYENCLKEQDDDDADSDEFDSDDKKREDEKFVEEGKEVADMQERLTQKLSVPGADKKFTISRDEAIHIAKMCGYQLALFNQSKWCDLLSDEDVRLFEYKQDLKHYWKRGYGHPVNYLVGCNLVRDIVSYFAQLTNGHRKTPKGVFKFSHAETIIPLECLLDLYKDKRPLTAATYQEHQSRLFRTSWMAPFAANVAFVLFNCSSDDAADNIQDLGEYRLQVLVNEIPVDLPFCQSGTCSLKEFSNHISEVTGDCSFNSTCCIENCGGGCKPFQFNEWSIFCISIGAVAFLAWILILIIECRDSGAKYTLIKKQ